MDASEFLPIPTPAQQQLMDFQYLFLSLSLLARLCYLAVILAVLWLNGYLWVMLAVATIFLIANLCFSVPMAITALQLARVISTIAPKNRDDDDDEIHGDAKPGHQNQAPKPRRK